MTNKLIGVVFGSESDLEHVRRVVGEMEKRGWKYADEEHVCDFHDIPQPKAYTIGAGSVHRDISGTLDLVSDIASATDDLKTRLIFLTCIGIRDEASGVISSYTGRRVAAVPPDAKQYAPKYPSGLRVYPFSEMPSRELDIAKALDWIEQEFENSNWVMDDAASYEALRKGAEKLEALREKLENGEIDFGHKG